MMRTLIIAAVSFSVVLCVSVTRAAEPDDSAEPGIEAPSAYLETIEEPGSADGGTDEEVDSAAAQTEPPLKPEN